MSSISGESSEREQRKIGRPTKAEQLRKQRANSTGSVLETFKRKREEEGKIRAEKEC